MVAGDFFAMTDQPEGFDTGAPGRQFDAILVDIDHSPDMRLDERSLPFYQPEGSEKSETPSAARRDFRAVVERSPGPRVHPQVVGRLH